MKRIGAFVFGAVAYAAFLGSFTYLIGFTSGLLVPKSVARGGGASLGTAAAIVVNCALILLFALQHSVMARRGFKDWMARSFDRRIHRSVYVLATGLVLTVMYLGWQPLPGTLWDISGSPAGTLLFAGQAIGWVVVVASTFMIDHFELFGLRQAWAYLRGHEFRPPDMGTPGFYRFVRHPLYLGFLIAFWSAPSMSVGRLVLVAGMSTYILIGIRFEERDMIAHFGERYLAYRRSVGAILPRPWARRASVSRSTSGSL